MRVGGLAPLLLALAVGPAHAAPAACQPNTEQPMLPIFHLIGNVSQQSPGAHIALEQINDVSGITYHQGLWHVWHQCCQDHWDHVISRDLAHWQRLPPPIQPLSTKTWDGSISMLPQSAGGPLILYDAQDGKRGGASGVSSGSRAGSGDKPILGMARLSDPEDKYLMTWRRDQSNPVKIAGAPLAFPGQIWRNGDHFNFLGSFSRYQTSDPSFRSWTNMGPFPNVSPATVSAPAISPRGCLTQTVAADRSAIGTRGTPAVGSGGCRCRTKSMGSHRQRARPTGW